MAKAVHIFEAGDRGRRARAYQEAIRKRLKNRDPKAMPDVDGVIGPETLAAAERAAHLLGQLHTSGSTEIARRRQALVWGAVARTPAELKRARERKAALRKKRKAAASGGSMRERAWQEAGSHLGTMEVGGNNRGQAVEKIIRRGGGLPGQAWCGWFVAVCYLAAGSKSVTWRWGAVRLLLGAGMHRTTSPLKGDIVRFTFDHTGLFGWWANASGQQVPRAHATHIVTREGNTGASGAVSDSRTGGDGVYQKVRPRGLVRDFLQVDR